MQTYCVKIGGVEILSLAIIILDTHCIVALVR